MGGQSTVREASKKLSQPGGSKRGDPFVTPFLEASQKIRNQDRDSNSNLFISETLNWSLSQEMLG